MHRMILPLIILLVVLSACAEGASEAREHIDDIAMETSGGSSSLLIQEVALGGAAGSLSFTIWACSEAGKCKNLGKLGGVEKKDIFVSTMPVDENREGDWYKIQVPPAAYIWDFSSLRHEGEATIRVDVEYAS